MEMAANLSPSTNTRSHSLTPGENSAGPDRQLQDILEEDNQGGATAAAAAPTTATGTTASTAAAATTTESSRKLTPAQKKRATLVKKAIRYFEDKSNRSVSEDNLFTRRKNLAVHLGIDEKVSKKEIQKINTLSLPVPATSIDIPDPRADWAVAKSAAGGTAIRSSSQDGGDGGADAAALGVAISNLVVVEDDEEELKSKNLVNYLGMKDGLTASIASQGTLSETPRGSEVVSPSPEAIASALSHAQPNSRAQAHRELFKF